jgi:hypothetical protein
MNSSIFAVGKMHIAFAFIALCAMILAPFMEVKAQAAQGTLTVNKVISGTTTVPFTDFSFLINGTGETGFEADGSNQVTLNVGTYDITEPAVAGFVTTYSGCEDVVLTATNSPTCTITNTASTSGSLDPGYLVINKVITGTTSASADDFSFDIVKNFITPVETNEPFEADGSNVYELSTGLYSITEDSALGFTATYANSLNGDLDCDSLLVTPNATTTCTITNTASSTGGTGTTTPSTGTLVVKKVLMGGNAATSSFSFMINGGATTTFDADGTNVVTGLATGTYAVTEVPAANYTPTYSNCTSAVVTAGATTTCTITNNFNVGGATLYEIEGYVWHDEDEDGVFDEDEDPLSGWMVTASATGELNRTDTTDAEGFYQMLVTEGTWTVSQTVQEGWEQTYPTGNTNHQVTFEDEEEVTWFNPLTWFLPLAHAQAAPQLFNFGNAQIAQNNGGGGGGGGNGVRIELTDDDDDDDDRDDDNDSGGGRSDDDDDDDTPAGQVLGEQTSVFPYGAPDTGMGGGELHKMDSSKSLPLMTLVLASLIGLGFIRSIKDDEEKGTN